MSGQSLADAARHIPQDRYGPGNVVVPPQMRQKFLLSMVRRLPAHSLGQSGRRVPGYDAQEHFQRGKGFCPSSRASCSGS